MRVLRRWMGRVVVGLMVVAGAGGGVAGEWAALPEVPNSGAWQDFDSVCISPDARGHAILYVFQYVRGFFSTTLHLAHLDLDDPYRRWAEFDAGTGPAVNGSWTDGNLLYATATNHVYFLDRAGKVLCYDGEAWAEQCNLGGVGRLFGFAANEIVAVGALVSFLYDGVVWSNVTGSLPSVGSGDYDLWRNGPRDYFVASSFGTFGRWNHGAWTEIGSGSSKQLTGVWGTSATNVWLAQQFWDDDPRLLHYDGTTVTTRWQPGLAGGRINALLGTTNGAVMALGECAAGGMILTQSGTNWVLAFTNAAIGAVGSYGPHRVAGGSSRVLMYRGVLSDAAPQLQAPVGDWTGFVQFNFRTSLRSGAQYQLQVCTNLVLGGWAAADANVFEVGDHYECYYSPWMDGDGAYYRVQETVP